MPRYCRRTTMIHPHQFQPTRRNFFSSILGPALVGAPILEAAFQRAAWARAMAQTAGNKKLFDIKMCADGVFLAMARPQALATSGPVIFVNAEDVLVVDSQLRPSSSA